MKRPLREEKGDHFMRTRYAAMAYLVNQVFALSKACIAARSRRHPAFMIN